ncbi:unnamed protein product [Mytilus coruscus]|uniref:Uncharacterized protein n=1 Tax=Mytilus coruscus TaxID=42192 RepID=A0A6J8CW22_MYTCO|nr:unnamed protein product [Mytilus coruscus]
MSTKTCESLKSYNYACQKFGTIETVRLRRNLYNLRDMIRNDDPSICHISSGSAVEGLDIIGSDIDLMAVITGTVVCLSERDAENVAEETNIRTLIMDIDNTNPCYALLRVPKKVPFPANIHFLLEHRGQDIFYSSQLFKLSQLDAMSLSGDRFKKDEHIQMIGLLKEVRQHGWQCFRVSGTFSGDFHTLYNPNYDSKVIHSMIWCMIESMADYFENDKISLVIVNKIIQFSRIKLAVNLIMFLWEKSNNLKVQRDTITKYYINNKLQYTHFQQQLRLLIISKHKQCPDTGWMFLASFFYRHKRYHIVLEIISYVLSRSLKVDPSTLATTVNIVHFEKMSAMLILHMLVTNNIVFENDSTLIPDELGMEVTNNSSIYLAVIIFTHFLKFLSYYHLGDFTSCMESLRGLEKCTYNLYRYNALGKTQIISSFLCLGIAHEMIGHVNEAHECFSTCVSFGELNTTKAALRLSKL